jgi:hypothetical protein
LPYLLDVALGTLQKHDPPPDKGNAMTSQKRIDANRRNEPNARRGAEGDEYH